MIRDNSTNTKRGTAFEKLSKRMLSKVKCIGKLDLQQSFSIGITPQITKEIPIDLSNSRWIIECKNYDWTKGDNIPHAKIDGLYAAILKLHTCCSGKRLGLAIKRTRKLKNESLARYFVRIDKCILGDIVVFEVSSTSVWQIYPREMQLI